MNNHDPTVEPFGESISYKELITSIIKRFGRLAGLRATLNVARKVPLLSVDDEGNVLDYNRQDPLGSITFLIDQYEVLYGEIARTLALQSAQPLAAANEDLLKVTGLLDSTPTPIRILLVDDHVLFREGVIKLLEAESDLKVVGQAGTIQEAMLLIPKYMPHLVLMDITLPDGTGVDATSWILEIAPRVKIVILSVHEDEEKLFEAIRAGAIGYLFKSVRAADLIGTIRGVMRGEAGLTGLTARRVLQEFTRLSPAQRDESVTLTTREIEVLRELANGLSNQAIAERLVISENTVKNHIRNVLVKLHFHSRREAAEYARRHGFTSQHSPVDPSDK